MNYMRKTILVVIAMFILAIAPMSLKADNPNKILIRPPTRLVPRSHLKNVIAMLALQSKIR